ncbi:MAG: UspA domain protein [Clostridia bacterium 62_21]|nr:MAG: UspA domain protein [Clostridia bacterium 62_21]HAG07050.1 universal stress protein [Peptococcaceae bacterium]
MFRKILVAYDGSEQAQHALRVALDIAQRYGAEVCTATVVHVPDYAGTVDEVDEQMQRAREFYGKTLQQAQFWGEQAGVKITTQLLFGHVGETLVRFAAQENADLVVAGARGLSAIRRYLMGSVSTFLVQHARCPVLVVKG